EFDLPAAIGTGAHENIGDNGFNGIALEGEAGTGIEPPQFGQHVYQVFAVAADGLEQAGHVVGGQKVEIVEQALHYRIEPVALGQLHAEAFGNSAGKDADGIAPPQGAENGFHIGQLGAEQFGNIGEFDGEIAGLVEPIDQMQRNQ